jgi:4a-hydroxytetrahydrobiopterin dehydratase
VPARLTDDEIAAHLADAPTWSINDKCQLTKTFKFGTYLAGADFARRAAQIAEDMDHHPDILILWRKVTLSISTHSAGGITHLDFDFALAVDSH